MSLRMLLASVLALGAVPSIALAAEGPARWAIVVDAKAPSRGVLMTLAKDTAAKRNAEAIDGTAIFSALNARTAKGLPADLAKAWKQGDAVCRARVSQARSQGDKARAEVAEACARSLRDAIWNQWLRARKVDRVLELTVARNSAGEERVVAATYVPTEEVLHQLEGAPIRAQNLETSTRELIRSVLEGESRIARRSASTQLPLLP